MESVIVEWNAIIRELAIGGEKNVLKTQNWAVEARGSALVFMSSSFTGQIPAVSA